MADVISIKAQLQPHVIKPTPDKPWVSMTRFSPRIDDFYFYDGALVILSPSDVIWEAPVLARSTKSPEEHIRFIQENQIEKACIIAEDISFLRRCPSLKSLQIIPAYSAATFDYSPLYDMPNLRELDCQTIYGPKDDLKAEIDYCRFSSLQIIVAAGSAGHRNLDTVKGLRELYLSQGQPSSKTLRGFDVSKLERLSLCQSPLRSLDGIAAAACLKELSLSYCRSLENISALAALGETLHSLEIEACGKIKDFTWLNYLPNLETLTLSGSNSLPNLRFLDNMKKLKTFHFTMCVEDGDLSLCKNIPYVSCQNRKHYNLKDSDLPKGT